MGLRANRELEDRPAVAGGQSRLRLAEVDGVRALAALMVFAYHTWEFSGGQELTGSWQLGADTAISRLSAGVDAFIVLSGFCLFLPFVSDPARFKSGSFLRRRAFRILPAYWASMVIAVTVPVVLVIAMRLVGLQANWQPFPPLKQWVTHLTMTHTFFPDTWNGINGVYWSLGLEVQFYVLLPLLILLYRRYGICSLAIPIGISFIWNIVLFLLWPTSEFDVVHFLWGANVFGRWFEFCFGMAAAWLVVRRHHRHAQFTPIVRHSLIAVATAMFGLCLVNSWPTGLQLLGYSLATAVVLVVLSEGRGWTARIMRFRPLAWLGLVSYSFYLLHQPLMWYFSQFLRRVGIETPALLWLVQATIGLVIVAACSAVLFQFFERPFLHGRTQRSAIRATEGL